MTEPKYQNVRILLVEDDLGLGELLRDEVEDAGLNVRLEHTAEDALASAKAWLPDLIVSDLRLPGADGLALLKQARRDLSPGTPDFLIITAFGSVSKAVECMKAGAEDFLTKPLDLEHFRLSLNRILEKRSLRQEVNQIRNLMNESSAFHGMYGHSRPMLSLYQQIRQVAKANGPVLISGESGTGKELVARAIHQEGKADSSPFLAVNCAGIPEHLLESEFFGHEAGAFTGAGNSRQGLFAEAEGGTLLLDEISEMPQPLQAKLLRMLQDGKIRPVGSNREQRINVRVLAATNRDLEQQVENKAFREDLFFRLETFSLNVPPLRDRDDDVDLLVGLFLKKHAYAAGKDIRGLAAQTWKVLHTYPFPGNVRELQNAIERAVVFCHDTDILPDHLPPRIQKYASQSGPKAADRLLDRLRINDESLPPLDEVERHYIQYVLKKTNGNKRMAASILGIARRTLYRRIDDIEDQGTEPAYTSATPPADPAADTSL